jgi:hypothetical protein
MCGLGVPRATVDETTGGTILRICDNSGASLGEASADGNRYFDRLQSGRVIGQYSSRSGWSIPLVDNHLGHLSGWTGNRSRPTINCFGLGGEKIAFGIDGAAIGTVSGGSFGFQGMELVVGMLWTGARMLDPAIGEFLSRDALLETEGRYLFAAGDTVNREDRSGFSSTGFRDSTTGSSWQHFQPVVAGRSFDGGRGGSSLLAYNDVSATSTKSDALPLLAFVASQPETIPFSALGALLALYMLDQKAHERHKQTQRMIYGERLLRLGLITREELIDYLLSGVLPERVQLRIAKAELLASHQGDVDLWGEAGSGVTATGQIRDSRLFWRLYVARTGGLGLSKSNLTRIDHRTSPIVDPTWIKAYPSHRGFFGDRIDHHHLEGSSIATPLPSGLHRLLHDPLHAYYTGFNHEWEDD